MPFFHCGTASQREFATSRPGRERTIWPAMTLAVSMLATGSFAQELKVPGTIDPQGQCAWVARERPELAPLQRACVMAVAGYETFPNFVCDVKITRMTGTDTVRDTITGELTFLNGEEQLSEARINGQAVAAASLDKSIWTEGEFGPAGLTVLSGTDSPELEYKGELNAGAHGLSIFEFKVNKEQNRSWAVGVGGVTYYPPYHGSLWTDKVTGVMRRVIMTVDKFEKWIPYSTLLKSTEYDNVAIAELGTYLLPTRSETRACWRNQDRCSEIVREFTNCRRFKAKARILE